MNETILKVIVIATLLMMLGILYATGTFLMLGGYTTHYVVLHKLSAFVIILLLAIHAWLRRCTIRRLLQECVAIVRNRHIRHEDNIDFLIHNTKNQSFQKLCSLFNYDSSFLLEALAKHHVRIENYEDSLKTIAKNNDKDMYQILLLMMKLHVEHNNPSPVYITSCSRR